MLGDRDRAVTGVPRRIACRQQDAGMSHTRTVPSSAALTTHRESALMQMAVRRSAWPTNRRTYARMRLVSLGHACSGLLRLGQARSGSVRLGVTKEWSR